MLTLTQDSVTFEVASVAIDDWRENMKDREREELLTLYMDLRVCDVRDGMDALGYFHYGGG